jgi:pectin methylesterase-like acyl-CoA thioesterase
MGYTHFEKISGINGIAVGKKGSEKVIADSLGRMYLNFEPGNQFYVDSGSGSASNDGLTWATALATIDSAVGKCTANNGDVIWVAPGHNEGITTAAAIDFDVAGITVIGLGTGSLKPTIDYDHADASVAIGADNVTLKNIRFRVSANAVVKGLQVEAAADSYVIEGCEFGWAETATDEFTIAIEILAGCNDGLIDRCYFNAGAQAAVHAIKLTGASDNVIIRNCRFIGNHSTAMIGGTTTLSTNLLIENNLFYQGATEPAIELLTNTTGVIRDNDIKTNLDTMVASIVADACFLFRNYYNEDVNPGTGAVIGTPSAND